MSLTKVTKLTPEQEDLLPAVRDRWIAIGLSTEPGDHAVAEQAIRDAYRVAGLEPPRCIVWLPSPLHGAATAAMISVENQTWNQVQNQFRSPSWDQVRYQVWTQVGYQVWDQVWNQVWIRVGYHVAFQIWDQVRDRARNLVYQANYGLHAAPWLALYDALGVCYDRLAPFMTLAEHAGWWWPFEGVCVITEKPTALHRDERGRLHHEDGPAVDYAGTWGVYAWHGMRVPAHVIEHPEDIHATDVLNERNAEMARVMLERMGIERFVDEARPVVRDADVDGAGQPRRLLAIATPHDPDGHVVVVEVVCPSTGRRYLLRVPPTMRTCTQAVAWTFGFEGKRVADYAPLLET